MQAIVVRQIGAFTQADLPLPVPGPGEVRIATAVTGLCRTDLKLIEVGHRDLVLPRVPGEEVVGTICAVGPGVPPGHVGTRVYVYPGVSCGGCSLCRQGAENLCPAMRIMGFHRDGGFAEYVSAPWQSTIPIPAACAFDQAVLAEPLSCCLNALELAGVRPEETVGIWGGGPAGALLARAAAALGAEPLVIEPDVTRHGWHNRVACEPGERHFAVAVVAVGAVAAYREAMAHLGPRGRLVVFSGLARGEAAQVVDFNEWHYREQTLVGAYGCSYRHGVQALAWIRDRKVIVDDLISHRLPLTALTHALELVRQRAGMKILLYPRSRWPHAT